MASLLKVEASPRGDYSVSHKVGAAFTAAWTEAHAGGGVVERDLAKTTLAFVDLPWIMGAYSPEENRNVEQREALRIGDEMIAEIEAADHILLTLGLYNFAIPAALKAYIDHVVRAGKTFRANADGSYTGLVEGKKATVVIASAGSYTPGTPAETYNFARPYLKHILAFIGITDVEFIEAGGTYLVDAGKKPVQELVDSLKADVERTATR